MTMQDSVNTNSDHEIPVCQTACCSSRMLSTVTSPN